MKRFISIILCTLMLCMLCSCKKSEQTPAPTTAPTTAPTKLDGSEIVGTWMCNEISRDCYFIFEENGDAFAKMGSSTVYGYYDYYADENLFDISITGFLFNEYTATFSGDKMTLVSEEQTSYTLKKAQMPEITITKPDDLNIDSKLIGDWQSPQNSECYRFNEDTTAVITDIMSEATLDCYYNCENGTITMYYMASETKDNTITLTYYFDGDTLMINEYPYEKVA